ncbi:MAG: hypothetical protein GY756_05385 [bacterium]|nr:hypothetical protein [bacterium]
MKGSIVNCLEDMVVSKFGKDKWERSLQDAGFSGLSIFMPFADVDDSKVLELVSAVCKNLNITLEQAADAFGDYWVNVYSLKMYSSYYQQCKNTKEFLLEMDTLHIQMTQSIKNAKPPRFTYEQLNDNTLIMNYESHRHLIDFVVGLAKGVGRFYKEDVAVTKLGEDKVKIVFN